MKIIMSPAHFVWGKNIWWSEQSRSYEISFRIANHFNDSTIVTWSVIWDTQNKHIITLRKQAIIDWSLMSSFQFMIQYSFKNMWLLLRNKTDIVHHILPFSIKSTFFWYPLNWAKLIIWPIQDPLTYFDEDKAKFISKWGKYTYQNIMKYIYTFFHQLIIYFHKKTLSRAAHLVCINQEAKKQLLNLWVSASKISIIPPWIDSQLYQQRIFSNNWIIKMVTISYLIRRKSIETILYALQSIVKKWITNFQYSIYWDWPEKDSLQKYVQELWLKDYVTFKWYIEHDEIYTIYKQYDVFISMSKSDSFAMVSLEAAVSWLIIISSKIGHFKEMIRDWENWFLVEVWDTDWLREKLVYTIQNFQKIQKIWTTLRNEALLYDWEKYIIPQYIDIYKSLIQ